MLNEKKGMINKKYALNKQVRHGKHNKHACPYNLKDMKSKMIEMNVPLEISPLVTTSSSPDRLSILI